MDPEETQVPTEPTESPEPSELDQLRAQLAEAQAATLGALRGQLLAEHRGAVVPELVTGSTPEELAASIDTARAAYSAIADQVRASQPASPALPNVARVTQPTTGSGSGGSGGGGGSAQPPAPSLENLSPMQKLQAAFASKNGKH